MVDRGEKGFVQDLKIFSSLNRGREIMRKKQIGKFLLFGLPTIYFFAFTILHLQ